MPLNNDQRAGVTVDGKPSFTVDQAAAQLDRADDWWSGTLGTAATVTYAYRADAPSMMPDGVGGFTRLTTAQITGAELAFEAWSDVANITFQRVGTGTSGDAAYSDNATILVGNYATGQAGAAAFTFFPGSRDASSLDGDVFVSSADADNANPIAGSYGLETLTHELGHAIGLSHPSDYEAGDDASTDPTYAADASYYEDSREYSIMSYFASSNTGGSASIFAVAPQLDDIAAAQRLYGANYSTRADDTTYGFNSNTNRPWYSLTSASSHFYAAIWDGGGNDTLDFSGYSQNQLIDLREGNFSNVGGDVGNLAFAIGAKIENAIGGSGNDTLYGNALANHLQGGAGDDTLQGNGGADILDGGAGVNTAVYSGFVHDYALNLNTAAGSVTHAADRAVSTLTSIQDVNFLDGTLTFDLQSSAAEIVRLYDAFLGRAPDLGGSTATSTTSPAATPWPGWPPTRSPARNSSRTRPR